MKLFLVKITSRTKIKEVVPGNTGQALYGLGKNKSASPRSFA